MKPLIPSALRLFPGISILLFFFSGCGIDHAYVSPELITLRADSVSDDEISATIFLIGDAGAPSLGLREPAFRALTRDASQYPAKTTIIFLGDNIYPRGLPPDADADRARAEAFLEEQVNIPLQSKAKGVFIPGNHDWDEMGQGGWENVKRQERFIMSLKDPRIEFLPRGGTPGPYILDLGHDVRIILLDTQWILHRYDKPLYPGTSTAEETEKIFLDSLATALQQARARNVIVAAHHPFMTYGEHGGFFDWKAHLFPLRQFHPQLWVPLPVAGSVVPIARQLGVSRQDLSNTHYANMIANIERVFAQSPPLAYVAGHEHSLQVLRKKSAPYYLISGNGILNHNSALSRGPHTIFASPRNGYMRLDVLQDKRVRLGVLTPIDSLGTTEELFSLWLRK